MITMDQFGVIPIDYHTLITSLGNYKSPKDKVTRMEKDGEIIRLKKGLFVVAQKVHHQTLSKELIANHFYGPSYVTCETCFVFLWTDSGKGLCDKIHNHKAFEELSHYNRKL